MSDLLIKAGDDTARMDTHEVAAYLLARLGPTLPARWATPPGERNHAEPSIEKARRLTATHTVFWLIEEAENDQVARNWLISANPRLDGITPAQLLREDQFGAVFRAADAFITDTYHA